MVSNEDDKAVGGVLAEVLEELRFRGLVKRRSSFVQEEDTPRTKERSSDSYTLCLPFGEAQPTLTDEKFVTITMTLTAPNCPAADFILEDVRMKVEDVEGVTGVEIQLTFEPEWNKDMMSEEAMLELGFL